MPPTVGGSAADVNVWPNVSSTRDELRTVGRAHDKQTNCCNALSSCVYLKALMSLFVLASRDGWVNIMYTGLDAVGVDQQVGLGLRQLDEKTCLK